MISMYTFLFTEIYLIVIASLACWTVTAANSIAIDVDTFDEKCPSKDPCPPILIPHPEDCSRFYECKNGRKVLQTCPKGLNFSPKWAGCVSPSKSECDDNSSEEPSKEEPSKEEPSKEEPSKEEPSKEISSEEECDDNDDRFPHDCDCHKFYECLNGAKVLRECNPDEHFSNRTLTCVEGKDCKDSSEERDCEDGDLYEHECKCTKYYECKRGRKILRECDEGEYFDKKKQECRRGNCPDDDRECKNGELKKHECKCEKYYRCKGNHWILQYCKKGFHFNAEREECQDPIKANCDPELRKSACPEGKKRGSVWDHECDCRLYYRCNKDRQKELVECEWGKYFDKTDKDCKKTTKVKDCYNEWDDWDLST